MALETRPIYINDDTWLRDFQNLEARDLQDGRMSLSREYRAANSMIDSNQWTVVNAPRPLPGYFTWQGPFRAGVFYAAGPWEEFGSFWSVLNATPCVKVTNAVVQAILWERLSAEGYTPLVYLEQGFSWEEMAHEKGLPWRSY